LAFGSKNEGRFVFPSKTRERFNLLPEDEMA
jgi:bifunctional DNA-binding transcriptional regulator/antitoxin component of YhaV-PrlF toxin-antitoxin module